MSVKAFIHAPELDQHPYPESCPFKTCRAGMVRERLESMHLLGEPDKQLIAPSRADRATMEWYHTPAYLDAIERADRGEFEVDMLHMGLGTGDCPVFHGMMDYAALAAGATVTAAETILDGRASIAFNPSGGYHHAFADRAGGFCYVNDIVLGCMRLARAGKRPLFLDIDVHHCDGVQAAFYDRSDVMTISTHQDGRTLFPGTGYVDEIGRGDGKGYTVNFPLPVGAYDDAYMKVFRQGVLPLIHAFDPDVIVLEVGADTLAGDPLAGLALTNNVYVDVINLLLAFGKPILATGGGGYNVDNTVRAWILVWTALCGEQSEHDLTAGMGGVMLQSMDWHAGEGLRDRVLVPSQAQRDTVEPQIDQVLDQVRRLIFPIHGLAL